MLVHSLLLKSRKRWAHDVIDTCITYAGLVHDVTDKLINTKWLRSLLCFRDFQTLIFVQIGHKSTEKQIVFLFQSIWHVILLCFGTFLRQNVFEHQMTS